jgi:hypothetical protein
MTGFNNACVIIVGYSFGDMDIGAELYSLRKEGRGIPWYAIFPRNDPQVRKMYSNRFEIEQINLPFEEFLKELDDRVNFITNVELKYGRITELRSKKIVQ